MESENQEKIVKHPIEDEVKQSYIDYAMSVLVGRALPDVRDGLKPVHKRVLHAMNVLGLASNKPTRKSARIVGDVIGKYHPHGDTAVYDTMVRMAQDFSMRYPLVIGQGNFGSIDGDSQAAMRYTEAKLSKLGEAMLQDIDKDTVDFTPNFDEQEKEPAVLPAMYPNLLVNGSTGIAVGMATNMAPHNMTEVCTAVIATLDNPEIDDFELVGHVPAPDFPTGGIILGTAGAQQAYLKGKGKVRVRGKSHIEETNTKKKIIFTEIPYMIKKEDLLMHIDACRRDKVIPDISVVRDESDKQGMRIVIELKQSAQVDLVLNQLWRHTRLESSFSIINLCLVDGVPKVLTLKELISEFIKHRKQVVTRRTQYELRKAEEKAHLLLGLKKAIDDLDNTIKIIRASSEAKQAKVQLIQQLDIDEIQAQAILDMRLQRLTGLERDKIVKDYNALVELITKLKGILADPAKIIAIIKEETQHIVDTYGDERRSEIIDAEVDIDDEDLIEDGHVVVTITRSGFIKRVPVDTYKAQARGGKGIIGATTRQDEDVIDMVFTAHTKSYILCFSNTGQLYWLKVYKVPEASRTASGKSIVNLLPLEQNERITTFIPVKEFAEGQYLIMATKQGTIKKTDLMSFSRPRANGIRAITLPQNDALIGAKLTDGKQEVMLATKNGLAARFKESDVRSMGRTAGGVRGIKLEDDEVVSMVVPQNGETILTITENGYGKRTEVDQYRLIGRGGKGVINIQTTPRNGKVVAVRAIDDESGILLMSQKGIIIRTRADQISIIGRNTQGVRVMKLSEADVVSGLAKIITE